MDYCNNHGIKRWLSIVRTPQHNGVVERKNMIVQEMARTMLMDSKLIDIFWTEVVHTIVHIQNKVILKKNTDKTPTSYGLEDQQMWSTSKFLEENATSKEKMEEWESLSLMWTKEYLLVTQVQEKHISVTIWYLTKLWKAST